MLSQRRLEGLDFSLFQSAIAGRQVDLPAASFFCPAESGLASVRRDSPASDLQEADYGTSQTRPRKTWHEARRTCRCIADRQRS